MPSPETLAKQREQQRAPAVAPVGDVVENEEGVTVVRTHHTIISGVAPELTELLQTIYGYHMQYQKRHLDNFELLAHDDRQFQTVRRIALDIINEEWNVLSTFLRQTLAVGISTATTEETKDGDTKNGHREEVGVD